MSAATQAAANLRPVGAADRVELLDILRGFALLGILLVNFWGDTGSLIPRIDEAVDQGLDLLVSSSFYPLYSFLFGLGFALQLLRARERGGAVLRLYVRRLLALFAIGTAHAVLIWSGDILVDYALLGFLIIPLHRVPPRWLLAAAAAIVLLNAQEARVRGLLDAGIHGSRVSDELTQGLRDEEARQAIQLGIADRDDGYADSVRQRWTPFATTVVRLSSPVSWATSQLLALFLVGLAFGKLRILQRPGEHRRLLAGLLIGGATLAIAGHAAERAFADSGPLIENLSWTVANYSVTAFYVGGLSLLVLAAGRAHRALRLLAPAGRMGLTNYLMQSVVMTSLFEPYAIGLSEPSTTLWAAINIAFFFGIQVPLSHWWLARFRFGPAEWLWRSMAYGAPQPMRRTEAAQPQPLAHPAA